MVSVGDGDELHDTLVYRFEARRERLKETNVVWEDPTDVDNGYGRRTELQETQKDGGERRVLCVRRTCYRELGNQSVVTLDDFL